MRPLWASSERRARQAESGSALRTSARSVVGVGAGASESTPHQAIEGSTPSERTTKNDQGRRIIPGPHKGVP